MDFAPEDLALATIPGLSFDPRERAFSIDELRPQPIIRKRKKASRDQCNRPLNKNSPNLGTLCGATNIDIRWCFAYAFLTGIPSMTKMRQKRFVRFANECNIKFYSILLQRRPLVFCRTMTRHFFLQSYVATDSKDEKYWEKRIKNNVAARRSREARRLKENQVGGSFGQKRYFVGLFVGNLIPVVSNCWALSKKYNRTFSDINLFYSWDKS
jgi:hypothetical protein